MLRLLRREEKKHLRSQLLDNNLIFKAFQAPVRDYEAKATRGYRMSPEEVFWEISTILDKIKEQQEDALNYIRNIWNDVYVEYRDMSNDDDAEEGIRIFTSLTVFALQVCLVQIDAALYRQMVLNIASQLAQHNQPTKDIEASVLNNITRIGQEEFNRAVSDYMESEEDWLSDEIEEVLEKTPESTVNLTNIERDIKNGQQLTSRQIVILFDLLLDVSLSSNYTNVSALAALISQVSGYDKQGVRTRINELCKKGYDSPSIRHDIETLAALFDTLKPDTAQKLRNLVK